MPFRRTHPWILRVEGPPIAKPRMSQRDKFDHRPVVTRYYGWANKLRAMAYESLHPSSMVRFPAGEPIVLAVDFHMPFPVSYPDKKRAELVGKPHLLKPDIKNLIAGVEDTLNKVVWDDDSQIWRYVDSSKFWTDGPGLTVIRAFQDVGQCFAPRSPTTEVIHRLSTDTET